MSDDERELDELLGAYALDAVSDDERRAVENYLLINPRARAEVAEHRETAAMLAWSGTAAPEGLWDRIAGSLDDSAPAPSGELAQVLAIGSAGTRTSTSAGTAARRRWTGNLGPWIGASAAAVVLAIAAVAVVGNDDTGSGDLASAADAARSDRDSKVTSLVGADGSKAGVVIIDPTGHGYLMADDLPDLPDDRTYQLWGVIGDQAISLGVLGNAPSLSTFTVDGSVTAVVVTNEAAGGVISDGNMDGAFIGTVG